MTSYMRQSISFTFYIMFYYVIFQKCKPETIKEVKARLPLEGIYFALVPASSFDCPLNRLFFISFYLNSVLNFCTMIKKSTVL